MQIRGYRIYRNMRRNFTFPTIVLRITFTTQAIPRYENPFYAPQPELSASDPTLLIFPVAVGMTLSGQDKKFGVTQKHSGIIMRRSCLGLEVFALEVTEDLLYSHS